MCADAKMMRLLAAELREAFAARKRSHRAVDPASVRKTAAPGLKQPLGGRPFKILASLVLLGLSST